MKPEFSLVLTIILPLIGALFIGVFRSQPNLRETATLLTGGILLAVVYSLYTIISTGAQPAFIIAEPLSGLPIVLEGEPLGMLFALVASFLWIVTTIYSIGYMRGHHEQNQTRFYIYFAIAISSTMGVAFAGNLLTLFIFYEVLTLSTFPLVTHSGTEEAKRAGRVYLGILLGTSVGLQLLAIIWTWYVAGSLDFADGGILQDKASPGVVGVLLALFVFGIGKAAIMPFHRWLPAAMVAPTPVSALLHAVAVVKAGVFSILKICIYIFGIDLIDASNINDWLLYLAGATILIASLVAMTKDNLKARLAYSTVSQLSYIILGALLGKSLGIIGGSMHIAMHAFGKITLFFCAGAIMVAAHKTEISQMRGLGKTMPFTMVAFFIGSLSIIGLPPMGGTWSKFYLALGAFEADQLILIAVLMISSLLNIAYLLPIPIRAFFNTLEDTASSSSSQIQEAPLPCLIAITITALGCIVLFFYPQPLFDLVSLLIR